MTLRSLGLGVFRGGFRRFPTTARARSVPLRSEIARIGAVDGHPLGVGLAFGLPLLGRHPLPSAALGLPVR